MNLLSTNEFVNDSLQRPNTREHGIALVNTLIIIVVLIVVVIGTTFVTQQAMALTRNDNGGTRANYLAQAGLQTAKTRLFQTYRYTLAHPPSNIPNTRGACSNVVADGIDWNRNGTLETDEKYPLNRTETVVGGTDQYTYTITSDPGKSRFMTVKSIGKANNGQSTVQATFDITNGGVWNYAIYSGNGSVAMSINGGVTIRGGLYVNGDPSNPNNVVLDAGGNFSQLNNYDLNDYGSNLKDRVESTMRVDNNLCATLRVKDGRVDLGGSSLFGSPDNKLLNFSVGNETSDIIGTVPGCSNNKGVCSDNVGTFDLDPATAPGFPTFNTASTVVGHNTWRDSIRSDAESKGLRLQSNGTPIIPSGAVLNAGCNPSSITSSSTLTFDNTSMDCTYTLAGAANNPAGGFRYTKGSPAQLEIFGTVDFSGFNVNFADDIEYRARSFGQVEKRASLIVEKVGSSGGNITFGGTFLPNTSAGASDQFPNQVLAVLAENNVLQSSNAKYVMAELYAGGEYRTVKSNALFGSVVTNTFCNTSAGGPTGACNAGQKSEVVYIDTGSNRPELLNKVQGAFVASYRIVSYERR
jgi:hypothetical protein